MRMHALPYTSVCDLEESSQRQRRQSSFVDYFSSLSLCWRCNDTIGGVSQGFESCNADTEGCVHMTLCLQSGFSGHVPAV